MHKDSYRPLVGILVSKGRKSDTFRGDASTLKEIQKQLQQLGGLSFVFTLDQFQHDVVTGYIYSEKHQRFGKAQFPQPDLIYNKLSTRKEETLPSFHHIKKVFQQQKKPFFNRQFFNKWQCYRALSKLKNLEPYLPKTWLFKDSTETLTLLNDRPLFAKPVQGKKGSGIFRLERNKENFLVQEKVKKKSLTESQFIKWISDHLSDRYILQEEMTTLFIDDCKIDIRVHCSYYQGSYRLTGIGVRKGKKHSILTHIPNGGQMISYSSIEEKCSTTEIIKMADLVGKGLSSQFGFVGEFSMDLGITKEGIPSIYEVNSKPMVFDEEDIQTKRIEHLVQLFVEL
ncbi:YheC/YheD family protein [Bacillus weihaiensis]|uniref:ATP-grasp domain-containing protein n=1 Tax=Bacillus weihaiensis TaxID=1547283 RepID=A0A1L3MUS3_9BACI|nr:YheC/YheD family protein [Bacillus weihaiensis]APH06082.1 hypothetical protein A9C19_15780 [Bacillus weihaiensis]